MEDKLQGRFTRIDQIQWSEQEAVTGWLKGMDFPVRLARQVFTNKDNSTGILYLACSNLDLQWKDITTIYQKRGEKSFINHLNLMLPWLNHLLEVSQSNHIFSSIIAVFKMECLKISNNINHFALRSKLYHKAIKTAFDELQVLKSV